MTRYIEEDSESGHTLLITAGVVAGLLAGAVVAQRLGGWRGVRRLLRGRRGALLGVLRGAIPSGTVGAVLDVVGIERLMRALLGGDEATGRRARRPLAGSRRRRRPDDDLDEYEVDDFERAAAGLDEDDEEAAPPAARTLAGRARGADDLDDEPDEEEEEDEIVEAPSPEAVEGAVLAAFRRHPVLRERALEISVDEDGILELTGWVRAERELRLARRVASRVEGVEQVIVDVAVRDGVRSTARAGAAAATGDDDETADAEPGPA